MVNFAPVASTEFSDPSFHQRQGGLAPHSSVIGLPSKAVGFLGSIKVLPGACFTAMEMVALPWRSILWRLVGWIKFVAEQVYLPLLTAAGSEPESLRVGPFCLSSLSPSLVHTIVVGRHLTVHYDFLTMFNFLLRWNRNFWTIQYVKFHFGLPALAQSNVRTANVGPSIFEIGSRD